MIEIKKTYHADTRGNKEPISKLKLKEDTILHISQVKSLVKYLSAEMNKQAKKHDYTKLLHLDEFWRDNNEQNGTRPFKDRWWYKIHIAHERHHLFERVPEDATIIDLAEMIADHVAAGLSRGGDIYPIELPKEVYDLIVRNTIEKLVYECRVTEKDNHEDLAKVPSDKN